MRRICFFPGTFALGGIGKLFINLIEEYVSRGIAVDVFLTKKEGEFIEQLPQDVRVFVGSGRALTSVIKFIKYLNNEKPDAVISAREFLNLMNIICCAFAFSKTKAVVSLHTNQTAEKEYFPNKRSLYNNLLFVASAKILYKNTSKIIAVSEGVAEDFSKRMDLKRDKIEVIYNPVYKPYEEVVIPNPMFTDFAKGNKKYIIAVGRFVHQKDFTTLINAFKQVRKRLDVSLIILGDGPLRQELEEQIRILSLNEHVLMFGFVENPLFYIKRASALVVSSKYEGFGNIIVEALGVGTPVVSTDCKSGPREILEDGKYGRLVPVEDPSLLASAIVDTLSYEHDKTQLIRRAQNFAVPKIADEYLTYIYH
jgi:glycosyltransferase involved in cell wall biosynthesis